MIAYTGIETVSNLAEEARDPARNDPARVPAASRSPSSRSTSRCPRSRSRRSRCTLVDGEYHDTRSASRPRKAASQNDPVLGLVENLGISRRACSTSLKVYVGILAATILFIATNAGVIGASRITYAMAQLPAAARGLPPAAPALQHAVALARRLRRRRRRSSTLLPGQIDFLGTMYSFGAMLSFTIAHASVSRSAYRGPDAGARLPRAARTSASAGSTGRSSRCFGGARRRPSRGSCRRPDAVDALRGARAGCVLGFVVYFVYRRWVVQRAADGDRAGARASCSARRSTLRVPDDRRAGRAHGGVGGGARRGRAPRGRRGARRSRSSTCSRCRSTCRSTRSSRSRRTAPRAPRRRAGARRELRRSRGHAARPRPAAPAQRSSRRPYAASAELIVIGRGVGGPAARAPIFGRTVDHVLKAARAASSSRPSARRHEPDHGAR